VPLGRYLPKFIQEALDSRQNHIALYRHRMVWRFVKASAKDQKEICLLDVGSGQGMFFEAGSDFGRCRLIGLDLSAIACRHTQKLFPDTEFVQASGLRIPFNSETFDIVHCSHVIEHLFHDDAYSLLLELARLVKLRGYLVIRSPTMCGDGRFGGFYADFTHVRPYPPESITHLLCNKPESLIQATVPPPPFRFSVVKLWWRHRAVELPGWMMRFRYGRYLQRLFHYSYRWGVRSRSVDGYTLILSKETTTR